MVNRQSRVIGLVLGVLLAAGGCGTAQAGQPAVRAASGASKVSLNDRHWINAAHQADMAEADAGRLAALIGGNPMIRSAGRVLDRDHTAFDARLIRAARALKLTLPQHETVGQITIYDRLTAESGHAFDHDFTASMMTAHQDLIAATRYEIAHGSSPAVVNLARQALPVLGKHLKMLQAAAPTG